MRTQGTFQEVYIAAREYYAGEAEGIPMDPVVRRVGDEWMLESGIDPEAGADIECPLDSFDMFFEVSYSDRDYLPTARDVDDFAAAHNGNR